MVTHPTVDELRDLVSSAKALGCDYLHFTVPRSQPPRGSWRAIRLFGRSGPLSSIDKACERVGVQPGQHGRNVQLWSAWWRVQDLDLWLTTGRAV